MRRPLAGEGGGLPRWRLLRLGLLSLPPATDSTALAGDPASILSAARRIHHDSASPSVRQEALRVLQMEKRAKLLQAKRQRAADIEASRRQQLEQRAALAKRRMDDAEARAKANRGEGTSPACWRPPARYCPVVTWQKKMDGAAVAAVVARAPCGAWLWSFPGLRRAPLRRDLRSSRPAQSG